MIQLIASAPSLASPFGHPNVPWLFLAIMLVLAIAAPYLWATSHRQEDETRFLACRIGAGAAVVGALVALLAAIQSVLSGFIFGGATGFIVLMIAFGLIVYGNQSSGYRR